MAEPSLRDCRILVVEDEYMLAELLTSDLTDAGAVVLGPVGSLDNALAIINAEPRIDGAVLDLNLHGFLAFPAADLLLERGVPFVFATGYAKEAIPPRLQHIPRFEKPVAMDKVFHALGRMIQS